ncbi:uncharacterized protein LOC127084377 isoform X6 [Lathyrus oleraceus]|uniref:Uncharacterized protein n=1 Tax=Pisum sativum TaxID=3888 RepID=A0A9D5AEA7_PEA|nr:uncharacterized protein LOC127084377 isoform X4 [Pisum sativum]XP_050880771.1 uncharacterized protein LOC127084377 isoform X5 [Pisum sativum]XP_050880772.1 uncharacterized protein LOC127084377 isoform X6 [Pisum sativum]KAI5408322.1 hypothetical protein KIW84_054229 [Pisum sativum]
MNKVWKGNKTLTGFACLLMVFAFERFKCLRKIFDFIISSQFPLMLGWANLTSENLRKKSLMPNMATCYDKFREMTDEEEGDVDEIETEEPIQENTSPISTCIPRCNFLSPTPQDASTSTPECSFRLPTPRDEVQVQTPFFDSSLSHEALSIQTPQEVLSPRCLHSLRYFYL